MTPKPVPIPNLVQLPPTVITTTPAQGFTKVLLTNATIPVGTETRLWPGLDVSRWDRLHLTIGADAVTVAGLDVRVLFSTPMTGTHCGGILTGSTVWLEGTRQEIDFHHVTRPDYGSTGFTLTVPVVAPILYDVLLRNIGTHDLHTIYVTLFAQDT